MTSAFTEMIQDNDVLLAFLGKKDFFLLRGRTGNNEVSLLGQ